MGSVERLKPILLQARTIPKNVFKFLQGLEKMSAYDLKGELKKIINFAFQKVTFW